LLVTDSFEHEAVRERSSFVRYCVSLSMLFSCIEPSSA
jgi:hypothetical protein